MVVEAPLEGATAPPSSEQLNNADLTNGEAVAAAQAKYNEERDKRVRQDGVAQYADLFSQDKFKQFRADPWDDKDGPTGLGDPSIPQEGQRSEILVVGAGYGGLLFAVRLLQAGFKLEDIRMVDSAGGFGGTWYWNRYPGLMCDVESYIYMPLLEETGYIPTMKYTSSKELREHAERIAKTWGLDKVAWFRQRASGFEWDEANKEWTTTLMPQLSNGEEGKPLKVKSRFTMLTTGVVLVPQVPLISGIEKFKGPVFHTARWDYSVTGGTHENPEMAKLKDKRVGIIGTGATAIQAVPALARWAKELAVFQRTPSSVDVRGNEPTNMEAAKQMCSKPGWQAERSLNWHKHVTDDPEKPQENMVGDGWTTFSAFSALCGGLKAEYKTPDDVKKLVERLHGLDHPRQEGIRRRVDSIVKDRATAEALKPWYPGWCKRACFHDEYLQSFNEPHVKLVDTNGQGVDRITEDSVFVGDKEYKTDILILSTGYRSPVLYSPPGRVGIDVKGRNGESLDRKWSERLATLHGMMSHNFPNFFWPGLNQAGSSPNFIYTIDGSAVHVAQIVAHAAEQAGVKDSAAKSEAYRLNFTVESSSEAEEEWTQTIVAGAAAFAATAGCTPSYFNAEGEFMREAPVEVQMTRARGSLWPKGPIDFMNKIKDWREKEKFPGLEIRSI